MAFHCQRIQQSHSGKEGVIARRQNRGKDNGIDDASSSVRARHFKDNREGGRAGFLGAEIGVVVWHIQTNEENREDTMDHVSR